MKIIGYIILYIIATNIFAIITVKITSTKEFQAETKKLNKAAKDFKVALVKELKLDKLFKYILK